jgi:hypothetical protein
MGIVKCKKTGHQWENVSQHKWEFKNVSENEQGSEGGGA